MSFSDLLRRLAGRLVYKGGSIAALPVRRAFGSLVSEWQYVPGGWRAAPVTRGWDEESVAAAAEKQWRVLQASLEGPGPLGVAHYLGTRGRENRSNHNAMMSFGYVLALAAREKQRVSILDWGGGAGHYYLYARALLPEAEIDYACYEVPALCAVGRRLLPKATFYEDAGEALSRRYDLVLASSALHYFEDWRGELAKLGAATSGLLYVARLQTVRKAPSFVVMQRPYSAGYRTEYISWMINRREFIEAAEACGLELVREFVYAESWWLRGAPEHGQSWGYLLRRRAG